MPKQRFRSGINAEARRMHVPPGILREIRETAGLTREQLAVRCGLASNTVYLAETGLVSRRTLQRLASIIPEVRRAVEAARP